jgi:hypothetical protein
MGVCPDCRSQLLHTVSYERLEIKSWHLVAACPDCDGEFIGQVTLDQLLAIIEAEELGMLQILLEAKEAESEPPEDH